MAPGSRSFLLLSSLLLFSFTNLVSADEKKDLQIIRETCNTTTLLDFCFSILSADPTSRGKDFHDLTVLAIVLAKEKGPADGAVIEDLLKNTTEPDLKQILETCSHDYNVGVVSATLAALNHFGRTDYLNAKVQIAGAIAAINGCDSKLGGSSSRRNVLKDINKTMILYLTVAFDLLNVYWGQN